MNYPKCIAHISPEHKAAYDFSKKKKTKNTKKNPQQTNSQYHCPGGLHFPTDRNNLIQSLFLKKRLQSAWEYGPEVKTLVLETYKS